MSDGLLRALLDGSQVRVSVVVATAAAREARGLHGLHTGAQAMLAQGLAAGALVASLQKETARINLQLECDGALKGMFVDASSAGTVRGYVKNPLLELEGLPGPFKWRPALGNKGFLSVLRGLDEGEFYRSAVELESFDLALDLNHYFKSSDQVPTQVALFVAPSAGERLGAVVGALAQSLPDADPGALEEVGDLLQPRLEAAALSAGSGPRALAEALFSPRTLTAVSEVPLLYACSCSKERVLDAISALGPKDVREMAEKPEGVEVQCHFCGRSHRATQEDLKALLTVAEA